jgi:hypothetical protein
MIVEAVNELAEMKIEYPSDVECQKKIAKEFCEVSKVKFDCCAGGIDGVLIWMHKPEEVSLWSQEQIWPELSGSV